MAKESETQSARATSRGNACAAGKREWLLDYIQHLVAVSHPTTEDKWDKFGTRCRLSMSTLIPRCVTQKYIQCCIHQMVSICELEFIANASGLIVGNQPL